MLFTFTLDSNLFSKLSCCIASTSILFKPDGRDIEFRLNILPPFVLTNGLGLPSSDTLLDDDDNDLQKKGLLISYIFSINSVVNILHAG